MSAPTAQQERATLRMERKFASAVEDVWSAWTDPIELCQWFGPPGYETIEAFTDLRPGGEYALKLRKAPDGEPFFLRGKFIDIDPGRRLVYSWRWHLKDGPGEETTVTVEFEAAGAETLLKLTHEQFPSIDERDKHNQGWSGCFQRLGELRTASDERSTVLAELRAGRAAVLDAIRGLTPEQCAWKPAREAWSINETLEHLALSEEMSLEGVRATAAVTDAPDLSANDATIIAIVRDRTQRFTAPERVAPAGRFPNPANAYIERRALTIQEIETGDGVVRQGAADSPIPGMPWDRYQWLRAAGGHSFRHAEQIAELRAAQSIGPATPAATASLAMTVELAATPVEVYDALVNGDKHAAFTGAAASSDARETGRYSVWDGYIDGRYLELAPGRRIVSEWSTKEWPADTPPSILEFRFAPTATGTRVTMSQTRIPSEQVDRYRQGWNDYYWTPLAKFIDKTLRRR